MNFGRQGIMILVVLGGVALLIAIVSPSLFTGFGALASRQEQSAAAWEFAAKGVVESKKEVEVSSQITGVIKKVLVEEGDQVKAGQPLIIFDDAKIVAKLELAEAVLRQSQAHLAQLERGYRSEDVDIAHSGVKRMQVILEDSRSEMVRMERLFNAGAVTEAARNKAILGYEVALAETREARANLKKLRKGPREEEITSARAETNRAMAELEFMQATLNDYTISSSIDGLVIDCSAESGETVDIKTPLFTIIDPDNLRVWAEIEETDAGKVIKGQNVFAEVEALPDKKFRGQVTQVFNAVQRKRLKTFDPVASFDINTQKIYIALDDYTGLVHGLTVTVLFIK